MIKNSPELKAAINKTFEALEAMSPEEFQKRANMLETQQTLPVKNGDQLTISPEAQYRVGDLIKYKIEKVKKWNARN